MVAILASYGDGARLTIDNFISDFVSNKFPDEKKEGIALIFGINKGYEAFRNKYKTENFEVDIKFKLDSQLDYYTIESIYQFVFNNKKDNYSFDYIDNWCVKLKENILRDDCETYQVLDKTISYKKKEKVVSQYLFQQFFQNFEKDFEEYTRLIFDKVKEQFEKTIQSQANEIFKLKENIEKLNLELKNSQETIQSRTNEIFKLNEKIDQQLGAILFPLEIGRQGLEKMNITKLKEEAKKMQIKNLHTFKNTPEGKDKLIAIMLQMESDKLKP